MDWLTNIVHTIGGDIQRRIGSDKPIVDLADSYFEYCEGFGMLDRYKSSSGVRFELHNQSDFDGFHHITSIKQIPAKTSVSKPSFEIKMKVVVYGREQASREWIWQLAKAFGKSISCEDASATISGIKIETNKKRIIQAYWPDLLGSLQSPQFCLELIEGEYSMIAKDCKC